MKFAGHPKLRALQVYWRIQTSHREKYMPFSVRLTGGTENHLLFVSTKSAGDNSKDFHADTGSSAGNEDAKESNFILCVFK